MELVDQQNFYKFQGKVGGKARSLYLAKSLGFSVPDFITLIGLNRSEINHETAEQILGLLHNHGFKAGEKIILRSSADVEDGATDSFAGIFDSYSCEVTSEDLLKGLQLLFAGLSSNKLKAYLESKKSPALPQLNIIVQKLIPSGLGGVFFSSHPTFPESGVLVNYSPNGPKAIVQGEHSEELIIPYISQGSAKLPNWAYKIHSISAVLRREFDTNVDVEFILDGSEVIILQIRPVTTKTPQKPTLIDASNLRENYPGQVLPLTYSFLQTLYRNTYWHLIRHSGVSESRLYKKRDWFDNLLINYSGQIFYNIGNWYSFSTLIPNSDSNNEALRNMITGKIHPMESGEIHSIWSKISYYSLFTRKFLSFDRTISDFQSTIREIVAQFYFLDYSHFSANDLYSIAVSIGSITDKLTYINAENDFLLMYFLQKLRNKINDENRFQQILTSLSASNPISSLQNFHLDGIAAEIQNISNQSGLQSEELASVIRSRSEYTDLHQNIQSYILKYSGRFPQELDLGQNDISLNTAEKIIRFSLDSSQPDFPQIHNNSDFETALKNKQSHPPLNNPLEKFYLDQVKKYLINREQNRLYRAQVFGVFRKIFNAVGIVFYEMKLISSPEDIHYLTYTEIWDYINLNSVNFNLAQLIKLRKSDYSTKPEIARWGTAFLSDFYNGWVDDSTSYSQDTHSGAAGNMLGKVEGVLVQVEDLAHSQFSDQKLILMAQQLDPGMVQDFGKVAGIIVAYGGILSHAAIISRELGIPAVIGYKNLYQEFKPGDLVDLNANTGQISKLNK